VSDQPTTEHADLRAIRTLQAIYATLGDHGMPGQREVFAQVAKDLAKILDSPSLCAGGQSDGGDEYADLRDQGADAFDAEPCFGAVESACVAMRVVQPVLDQQAAEIADLRKSRDGAEDKLASFHAVLTEAAGALLDVGKAAITVKPRLDKPYTDAPETTPWRQFMEQPAKAAYNLGHRIRRNLKKPPAGLQISRADLAERAERAEAELAAMRAGRPTCGCADADRTYAEMERDLTAQLVGKDADIAGERDRADEAEEESARLSGLMRNLEAENERLRFQLNHTRAELAKADAENNANGQRAEQAEANNARLLALMERLPDEHMRFGVIGDKGVEMLPCADWCWACRLQRAEQRARDAETEVDRLTNKTVQEERG
jgi:hypothetical protein